MASFICIFQSQRLTGISLIKIALLIRPSVFRVGFKWNRLSVQTKWECTKTKININLVDAHLKFALAKIAHTAFVPTYCEVTTICKSGKKLSSVKINEIKVIQNNNLQIMQNMIRNYNL